MERIIEKELSFTMLRVVVTILGADYLISVEGGTRPHIGSVVMAIPRASLKGDDKISCTSSVLNVTGHKDEEICRSLAEAVAVYTNGTAVCIGGFHVDDITETQIAEVRKAIQEIKAGVFCDSGC